MPLLLLAGAGLVVLLLAASKREGYDPQAASAEEREHYREGQRAMAQAAEEARIRAVRAMRENDVQ